MAMTLAEALDKVFEIDLGINSGDAQDMLDDLTPGNVSLATVDTPGIMYQAENVMAFSNAESATATECAEAINEIIRVLINADIMNSGSGGGGGSDDDAPAA